MQEIILYALTSLVSLIASIYVLGRKTKGIDMSLNQLDDRLKRVEELAPMANDVRILQVRMDQQQQDLSKHELFIQKAIEILRQDIKELSTDIKTYLHRTKAE